MTEFLKCGFCHFKMDEDDEESYSCKAEAHFTCCDYGNAVCVNHKCRCSKPLSDVQRANLIQNQMEWQVLNVLRR